MDMYPPQPTKKESNALFIVLVFLGLAVIVFALGKSVFDVATMPPAIDLAADDAQQAGFLPVYSSAGHEADPSLVSVGVMPDGFPTPQPLAEGETPVGQVPDRIIIPAIELDASIVPIGSIDLSYEDETFQQWLAPDYRAVGWHQTSAGLGVPGNTVLNGHHNVHGEVFRDLYRLQKGDEIEVYSNGQRFQYVVVYTAVLPERNQPMEVRVANAEWIQPTEDERLTVITCWPYESNTHRVLIVAVPVSPATS
ncbi:MAG: sortase [Anaerolineales bacterium]|jgi:LPXTG-site transpeptidase (sortase) family protein|nr:sortase [Anaerolineales bacterium]